MILLLLLLVASGCGVGFAIRELLDKTDSEFPVLTVLQLCACSAIFATTLISL